jgi:hypothetical protein
MRLLLQHDRVCRPTEAEEKVGAQEWTVRHGKTRCASCSEFERLVLARALARLEADLSRPISLAGLSSEQRYPVQVKVGYAT